MIKRAVLILFSLSLFNGCATVEDVIYLQDIEVSTPLNIPPLYIRSDANKERVTFSPRIFVNNKNLVEGTLEHSRVNRYGVYELDTVNNHLVSAPSNWYTYSGKNIHWTIPDYTFGFDLDIPLSSIFSINGAVSFSNVNNDNLIGNSFGFSLHKFTGNHSISMSGGLTWQQFKYTAQTAIERTVTPFFGHSVTSVTLFIDDGKDTDFNFYMSLLYNSAFPDWLINFYIGASFFKQSIFDFNPENTQVEYAPLYVHTTTDARGEATGDFFNFSPGLYKDISDWMRLTGGVNFVTGTSMDNSTESYYMLPYFKIDFFL